MFRTFEIQPIKTWRCDQELSDNPFEAHERRDSNIVPFVIEKQFSKQLCWCLFSDEHDMFVDVNACVGRCYLHETNAYQDRFVGVVYQQRMYPTGRGDVFPVLITKVAIAVEGAIVTANIRTRRVQSYIIYSSSWILFSANKLTHNFPRTQLCCYALVCYFCQLHPAFALCFAQLIPRASELSAEAVPRPACKFTGKTFRMTILASNDHNDLGRSVSLCSTCSMCVVSVVTAAVFQNSPPGRAPVRVWGSAAGWQPSKTQKPSQTISNPKG